MTQATHQLKPAVVRALRQSRIEQDTVFVQAPGDRALEQTVVDVLREIGGEVAGPNAVRFSGDPKPILKRLITTKAIVRGQGASEAPPPVAPATNPTPAPAAAPKVAKPKREPSNPKSKARRELQILDGRGAVVVVLDVSDLGEAEVRKIAARMRLPTREPVGLLLVETTTREFKV